MKLRIRTETCQQLKQLLYLCAGHHHQSTITSFGVEPCCQLFAWEASHSSRPPPYGFEQFSLQMVKKSPFINTLLDVLLRIPRESGLSKRSSSATNKPLLPPLWTTNQLNTLMDNEDKQTLMHCSEFFRLRGRIYGLVDEGCLEEYAGQGHEAVFEVRLIFFSIHSFVKEWEISKYTIMCVCL